MITVEMETPTDAVMQLDEQSIIDAIAGHFDLDLDKVEVVIHWGGGATIVTRYPSC